MLISLAIKDFAVVSEAEAAFGAGMTVISGETGAGKSLLVDALMLLSGARADAGMVRHGAERAELTALFDLGDAADAAHWLRDAELDEEDACQLRRVIRADGGSRAWINGRPASLSQLSEIGALLVEIHGQHEHQALLVRSHQMTLLDTFGRHQDLLGEVRRHTGDWQDAQRKLAARGSAGDAQARRDWLEHQLKEFLNEALEPADIEELLSTHRRQSNASQLIDGSTRVLARLQGDGNDALESGLAQSGLAQLRNELQRMAEHDPRYGEAAELVDGASIQLAEAASLIERARDELDLDPAHLQQIEQRMSRLHDLARKHRVPLQQLSEARNALQAEHESLRDAGDAVAQLERARDAAATAWRNAADQLTKARKQAAGILGTAVSALLGELGMGGGTMLVELTPATSTDPSATGAEQVELLISTNPGQPPRPLRKIASGGELSRISLAIEVAALGMDTVPSMVFDEVDSGIGGAVAEVVGQKLRALGQQRQVLCVTHLPQVAAQGHQHFRVSKDASNGSTHSALSALDTVSRIEELARMLGGVEITRETRANAKQMLLRANPA